MDILTVCMFLSNEYLVGSGFILGCDIYLMCSNGQKVGVQCIDEVNLKSAWGSELITFKWSFTDDVP